MLAFPASYCLPSAINAEDRSVGTGGTGPCVTANGSSAEYGPIIEEAKRRAENKESGPSLLSHAVADDAHTATGIVLALSYLNITFNSIVDSAAAAALAHRTQPLHDKHAHTCEGWRWEWGMRGGIR